MNSIVFAILILTSLLNAHAFINHKVRCNENSKMKLYGGGPIRGELIPKVLDMIINGDVSTAINDKINILGIENKRFMVDVPIEYMNQQVVGTWNTLYPKSNGKPIALTEANVICQENNTWKLRYFEFGDCDVLYVNSKYLFLTRNKKYYVLGKV